MTRFARPFAFPAALLAVNYYFCLDLFRLEYSAFMGSIEAAYVSISRYVMENWSDLTWFPLWYGGIPFQNTYPPLLHLLVAAFASAAGVSAARAHHVLTAVFYCLGPLAVYFLALRLTGSRWYSFWAGLAYSILSPSAFLIQSVRHDLGSVWGPRRFNALVFYGEGPHIASLTLLPLAIICLDVALSKRKPLYYVLAALSMVAVVLSNWLGAFALGLAVLAYLGAREGSGNWVRSCAIGALAYALTCPWIPPSTIRDIRNNAQFVGDFQHVYERLPLYAAIGLVAVLVLTAASRRFKVPAPPLRFFLLLAFITAAITLSYEWFGIAVVPQAARYHLEMDMALCLAGAFAAKSLLDRFSNAQKAALACTLLLLCVFPIRHNRRYARRLVHPVEIAGTIEYKSAKWFQQHAPGQRVMAPGSVSYWLNAFGDTPQFAGGFDQGIVNRTYRHAWYQIVSGAGPMESAGSTSVIWLKAYGVAAIEVGGPKSREAFKPIVVPERFQPLLTEIERDGDDVLYLAPHSSGLAHVIAADAVVKILPVNGIDTDQTRKYVAALEDPAMPPAEFRWTTRHSAVIGAQMVLGTVISVQETYHPGWHASVNGAPRRLRADGLGQIIIETRCQGRCTVELNYDGGVEMRIAKVISWSSLAGCLIWIVFRRRAH